MQDFEGLDFKDALHMLAVRAGVEIIPYQGNKEDSKNSKDQKDRLYKIIEEVVGIYKKDLDNNLPDSQKAKKYILTRGLNSQTLKTFSVGYARNEWRYLTTTLKERGYTDDELISSGLSVATTKGLYDKFRGRIMFPITNSQGKFVGFSGRVLPEYAVYENGNEAPKYMNSPETELYHKSSILYGYDIARDAIRKNGRAVVVEGMMDVLMSHQAGVFETVAVSGTALTNEHAKILRRLAEKVYLCFDRDEAGINAMFRILPMLIELDIDLYIVSIPDGKKDPADIVFESDVAWLDLVSGAQPLIDYLISYAKLKNTNLKDLRNFADSHILPIIAKMIKVMNRAHAINLLARALDLPEETLYRAVLEKDKQKNNNQNYIKEFGGISKIRPPSVSQVFIGLSKLKLFLDSPEYKKNVENYFAEFLGEKMEDLLVGIETDGHTFESYAQKGFDESEDKVGFIKEMALGFIKNNLETKLKALKNNENDLEIISDYTKRLDLINRQHHTNNYE